MVQQAGYSTMHCKAIAPGVNSTLCARGRYMLEARLRGLLCHSARCTCLKNKSARHTDTEESHKWTSEKSNDSLRHAY